MIAWLLAAAMFALTLAPAQAQPQDARYRLSHAALIDQHGKSHRFAPDAIGDRVVVVGFTWLGCRTVCPITDQIMKRTQELMLRNGKAHRMITITLDPVGDPPRKMARRAAQLGAGSNWLWLSGPFNSVRQVLSGLDALEADLAAHPPGFLIIDGKSKVVHRLDGTPRPEEILAKAEEVLASRR